MRSARDYVYPVLALAMLANLGLMAWNLHQRTMELGQTMASLKATQAQLEDQRRMLQLQQEQDQQSFQAVPRSQGPETFIYRFSGPTTEWISPTVTYGRCARSIFGTDPDPRIARSQCYLPT